MATVEEGEWAGLWEAVESKRYQLSRAIAPAKLTPYLRQCRVLDEQDEDEVLTSMMLASRANRTSRLLDILRTKGERGLVAFLESLEFHYPDLYQLLTGKEPTRRFSTIVVEEGHEGLTQLLMEEVVKLQQQTKAKTLQQAELSRKNCTLEDEGRKLRLANQELTAFQQRYNKLKEERNSYSDELLRVKDENYKLAMRYAALSEEKNMAVMRSRDLQLEIDQLKHRLNKLEEECRLERRHSLKLKSDMENRPRREQIVQLERENEMLKISLQELQNIIQPGPLAESDKAILDILEHDRQEALEDRQDLVNRLYNLHEDVRQAEELRDKYLEEKEELELKCSTLQKDCEMYRNRMDTISIQLEEVEKERDQAFGSRDEAQHQFSQSLIDKDKYRKQIRELEERGDELQADNLRKDERIGTLETKLRRLSRDDKINSDDKRPRRDSPPTIVSPADDITAAGQTEWSSDESPDDKILPDRPRLIRRPNLKAVIRVRSPVNVYRDFKERPAGADLLGIPSGRSSSLPPSPVQPLSPSTTVSLAPSPSPASLPLTSAELSRRPNMLPCRNDSILSILAAPPEKASLYRRERETEDEFNPRSLSDFDSDNMEFEDEAQRPPSGPPSVVSSSSSYQSEGMDSFDLEAVSSIFRKFSLERPFRPSLSSFSRISSSLKPVQVLSVSGENLLKEITLVGGNQSGIFVSSVQSGSSAERAGLREGQHLLLLEGCVRGENQSVSLDSSTQEEAVWTLQHCSGPIRLHYRVNHDACGRLQREVSDGQLASGDSFFIRSNFNVPPPADGVPLAVRCDEVVHVLDTRHQGRSDWLCCRVDPYTGSDLAERGAIPSYARAQQLLVVKIQKLVCRGGKEENDIQRNKVSLQTTEDLSPSPEPKSSPRMSRASIFLTQILQFVSRGDNKYKRMNSNERVRIVNSGGSAHCRTPSDCREDPADPDRDLVTRGLDLVPYSPVTPQRTSRKRPVLLSPAALTRILVPKILSAAGNDFSTCRPEVLWREEVQVRQNVEPLVQNIQAVASKGKHCLLEAELSCVRELLKREIYPIIIFVKICERNVKRLRKWAVRVDWSEEELVRASRASEKELEGVACLYATLEPDAWNAPDDIIKIIRERVQDEQRKTVWVEQDLL